MMIRKVVFVFIAGMMLMSCSTSINEEAGRELAKFEPQDGQVILFVGQELEAIGGLEHFNDGYLDHFEKPAGWTAYTNLTPGDTSFRYIHTGLDGIWQTATWGDGESNMSQQLSNPDFDNMALAIGLAMVNYEERVASGELDTLVIKLGEFLKSLSPRPIFLRIGYEFDGHSWNHYNRVNYLAAFKRIKDLFDELGADNIAYVWQSTGWVSDQYMLEEWYPGDDYVDWCAFSFFSRWKEQEMIDFARKKGKPVFIAEATPAISDHMVKFNGATKESMLSNPEQAAEAWEKWFIPLFRTIDANPDVVKAISYINCNWRAYEMWEENPSFNGLDARLQKSDFISEKWIKETSKPKYLKSIPTLYQDLNDHK